MYIVNQKLVFKYLMSSIAIGLTLPDVINLKFYLSLILIFFCQSQCMTTNTVLDNIKLLIKKTQIIQIFIIWETLFFRSFKKTKEKGYFLKKCYFIDLCLYNNIIQMHNKQNKSIAIGTSEE